MRKTVSLLVAAACVMALASCSSGDAGVTQLEGCSNTPSGSASNSVKVTGEFAKTPKVKIPSPLKVTEKGTERTIVIPGKGEPVKPNSTVDVAFAAYNGTTGKELTANGFDGSASMPVPVDVKQIIPGIVRTVECVDIGSRVVTTANVKTAWGQGDPSQLGLKPTDSIVFVVDLLDVLPTKADGKSQPAVPGMPTVKLAKDGAPTVTIPKADPPTETKVAVLKQGDGKAVADGETVTAQYQGVIWATGKVFDQSWGKAPVPFPTAGQGVIPGFKKALVGQKVGSQVLVVIPPADGYGAAGQPDAGISGTDTLVFVIDILKTVK
ncbi:MAG: FKBP-type peptidyl-prolyl cis-trans isomerase [Microbacteriaceae bacterium]